MIRNRIKSIFLKKLKEFKSTKEYFLEKATTEYENVVAILLAHGADQVFEIENVKFLDFYRINIFFSFIDI